MATETAQPPNRLWQLPAFAIGVAALIALWHYGERIRPSLAERYEKALIVLRPAVDRLPPDADQLRAALRKLPSENPPGDMEAKVRYVRGSAYVALAESTNSPNEAAEWWTLARQDLEFAADQDLPAGEQRKLRYRLARAWAHTPEADVRRTIEALAAYVNAGDDPAEGHRLLTELHRKLTPPDENGEREALQNFLRHASPRADARTLNGARVRLAELLCKQGNFVDAKKVLERVGADAPPELFAAAKLRAGSIAWAEEDWSRAAQAWEEVRALKAATTQQKAEALVKLAEAYVKLGRTSAAEAIVREVGRPESAEGRAVTFRQAEMALRDPAAAKDAAIGLLERAFEGADRATLRRLITPTDAKRVCELAVQSAIEAKDYALALRGARAYGLIADAGDHERLVAEARLGLAAAAAIDPARAAEAAEHYRSAGSAAQAAAALEAAVPARVVWLRKAANAYVKSGEKSKALAMLAEVASHLGELPEDQAAIAWLEVGQMYRVLGELERARQVYQTIAARPGPQRDQARVQLAALTFELDPTRAGLQIVAMLEEVVASPPKEASSKAAFEEATYLLGEIHLVQKEWDRAEQRLRLALESFPESPRAPRGRYQFAQVMRHNAYEAARKLKADRALLEEIRAERLAIRQANFKSVDEVRLVDRMERAQKTYDEMMRRAHDEFRKAEEAMLASPESTEPAVVRRTSFWVADCAYWLGEFNDCAARCDKLTVRYRGKVEELEAYRDLLRCCQFAAQVANESKDTEAAGTWARRGADALAKAKDALGRLPAAEFDNSTETKRREYWDAWLTQNASRPARD